MTQIEITAYYDPNAGETSPSHAAIFYSLTPEQVAVYPKSLKLKATFPRVYRDTIVFAKNGVVGEKNEAGIRRVRKLFEAGAIYKNTDLTNNAYCSKQSFLGTL